MQIVHSVKVRRLESKVIECDTDLFMRKKKKN